MIHYKLQNFIQNFFFKIVMFSYKFGKWISHNIIYVGMTIYPKVIATNQGNINIISIDKYHFLKIFFPEIEIS